MNFRIQQLINELTSAQRDAQIIGFQCMEVLLDYIDLLKEEINALGVQVIWDIETQRFIKFEIN